MILIKTGILFFFVIFSLQDNSLETPRLSMNTISKKNDFRKKDKNQTKLADCVKVAVSHNLSELINDQAFPITINIENQSKERISLNYLPMVILQKKGVSENEKGIKGNQFYTILYLPKDSEFVKRDFLEPGDKIEFEVDITKSKWGHSIQANLPSSKIFTILPKGEYELYIKFRSSNYESDNKNINYFTSNSLDIFYK